jgi:prephenate dehydrogenase/chorismate mutase/prephenate dehydrogenase
MTPEDHDEMMAIIQGLNHFNTIMMELALRDTGVDRSELKKYSTPIFNTKLGIIDKICTTEPRLHAEILTLNPHLNTILDLYEKNLTDLKSLIKSGNTEGLMKLIRK